jgi:hypothetical protein
MLYEPLYPVVTQFSEMSDEHKAHVEDFFSFNWTGNWAAYGSLCD